MKVELNTKVWVKLTPYGIEQFDRVANEIELSSFIPGLAKTMIRSCKRGEWYEFTLGELMRNFGPVCISGFGTTFVNNEIYFKSPLST